MNIAVDTFCEFTFRARHSIPGLSPAAAREHWHTYVVRFWFDRAHDQDVLALKIEQRFVNLHGAILNEHFEDSSDEGLAKQLLVLMIDLGCREVSVTNDGRRGAVGRRTP